nr:hypothetical protein CparaKRNrm2_p065 [Cryptomonas paramecium]
MSISFLLIYKKLFLYVEKIFIIYFFFFLNYTFFLNFSDIIQNKSYYKFLLSLSPFFFFLTQKTFKSTVFIYKKNRFSNFIYCNLLVNRAFFLIITTIYVHSSNILILLRNLYFWTEVQFLFFFSWYKIDLYDVTIIQFARFLEILHAYLLLVYKDEFYFIKIYTKLSCLLS